MLFSFASLFMGQPSSQPKASVYPNGDGKMVNSLSQQEYKEKKGNPFLSAIRQYIRKSGFITGRECSKFIYLPFCN